MAGPELWGEFALDPRDPRNAGLRAADADREVVHRALGDAFAEGRLDRDEFDERSAALAASKHLGALPPLLEDLLPVAPLIPALPKAQEITAQATQDYRDQRRRALLAAVWVSALCWAIWLATSRHQGGNLLTGWDTFPWPLIVTAATGVRPVRLMLARSQVIADRERKLQQRATKQQAKALEEHRRAIGEDSQ